MYVVNQSQLPFVGVSHEFVGTDHGGIGISFFVVIAEPSRGPRLHKHGYVEIVYVIEGRSEWRVTDQEGEASARADQPHRFINIGDGPL
jgi:quercetin dioxygenase-like cupin family protein